jgi:small subunit ribosomal protein S1
MDWTRKNVHPASLVKVGDEVEAMMLEVDKERRRISLGMKQCHPNPWQEFAAAYRKGSEIAGKVRSITDFGMFVQLPGDIDGLVHIGDISYTERGEEALRHYQKGMEIKAMVLAIDAERERIGLGIKQLGDAGFEAFAKERGKNSTARGRIVEIGENGALAELADGITGFLPAGEIAETKVEDIGAHLKVGDELDFMVINLDRRSRQITLSLKARDRAEREEAMRKFKDEPQGGGTTSLGALLRAKLEDGGKEAADGGEKPAAKTDDTPPEAKADDEEKR